MTKRELPSRRPRARMSRARLRISDVEPFVTPSMPLPEVPLAEFVYLSLRESIRSGRLRPGDRIRELETASRLKVSRTPVRVALGRLVTERLLIQAPGRGLVVSSLSLDEIRGLYALREELEGVAARWAATMATDVEIRALQDIIGEERRAIGDWEWLDRVSGEFHTVFFAATRNTHLVRSLKLLREPLLLLRGVPLVLANRAEASRAEHSRILRAIERRDPKAAEAAARKHMRLASGALIEHLMPSLPPHRPRRRGLEVRRGSR